MVPSNPASDERTRPVSEVITVQAPPTTMGGVLRRLGPGLIIAGSIVGSGELIMTTKTGAEAGYWLLWLIVIGCIIKVFVQIEFGRFAITQGKTSLEGMNELPGPRLRVNWLVWYWVLMFTIGLGQLGGILGGVGQSLAISVPITGDYNVYLEQLSERTRFDAAVEERLSELRAAPTDGSIDDAALRAGAEVEVVATLGLPPDLPMHYDDLYWCCAIALVTSVLLVNGRYGIIQAVATTFVALFTLVTIVNLAALQSHPDWATGWSDLRDGFSFALPPNSTTAVATALAAFGIIGVGASELVAYPYWCLEKGYARFTGPRAESDSWAQRASGWLRVMRWDAWCSMFVYTFATLAFYLLGAAVLNRAGTVPANEALISTLANMYVPVFGRWAAPVLLGGAFAVLYSTFFVATAGNSRLASDALRVFGIRRDDEASRHRWVRIFSGAFPIISLTIFYFIPKPVTLVAVSGLTQAIMLPMLGAAALFFRYRRCDSRLRPSRVWDGWLWLSCTGLLIAGAWGARKPLMGLLEQLGLLP